MMPEIQERVDSDTVYCKVCGYQLSSALSTLSVHNMRRHEYHPDLYDYEDWEQECDFCGGKEYAGLDVMVKMNLHS